MHAGEYMLSGGPPLRCVVTNDATQVCNVKWEEVYTENTLCIMQFMKRRQDIIDHEVKRTGPLP